MKSNYSNNKILGLRKLWVNFGRIWRIRIRETTPMITRIMIWIPPSRRMISIFVREKICHF